MPTAISASAPIQNAGRLKNAAGAPAAVALPTTGGGKGGFSTAGEEAADGGLEEAAWDKIGFVGATGFGGGMMVMNELVAGAVFGGWGDNGWDSNVTGAGCGA